MTPTPQTINFDQTVDAGLERMRTLGIRHLPVMRAGQLVGLVSDRDLARVHRLKAAARRAIVIGELMPDGVYTVAPQTPIVDVVEEMAREKYGSAVVLDRGQPFGIFTTVDACRALAELVPDDAKLGAFMTPAPDTIGHQQTLAAAHDLMRKHAFRHLPVLENGTVVGVLSARDVHAIGRLDATDERALEVWQAMSRDLLTAGPRAGMRRVLQRMAQQKCGSTIVVERGNVIGILTTVDVLRALRVALRAPVAPGSSAGAAGATGVRS